ncbi:hypothetical protein SAMN06298216_1983 [Spirosomataceae bacterium TFI 002]|nr:hypothetical protein SAMN06298216_1983 [Spirosomataceae bacterium TFI 002]
MIATIGLFLALIIGITLGLIGAGGAILTVSVLVYILGYSPLEATSYSLVIVGVSSLVGAIDYARKGLVDFKKGLFFSFPAFVMVLFMRQYVLPRIPEHIYQSGDFVLTKNLLIMVVFAVLMMLASISMIWGRTNESQKGDFKVNYVLIFIEGLFVGVLTGLVGAGGGFLIIPAMVLFAKLPMKTAVGTSLVIITINSLFGIIGDIVTGVTIDYFFLAKFASLAIAGVLIGSYLSKYVKGEKLKPAFGYFILIMGFWILVKELIIK